MMNDKRSYIIKSVVKDVDLKLVKPPRAGLILYTRVKGDLWFGLGVDRQSGELTDFGGGVSYKRRHDEHVIAGALREFNEETLNILKLTMDDVKDCPVLYDNNMLIMFKCIYDAN